MGTKLPSYVTPHMYIETIKGRSLIVTIGKVCAIIFPDGDWKYTGDVKEFVAYIRSIRVTRMAA